MRNVVFNAPFFLETTLRFVEAVVDLPDVRLGLISQDAAEKLPRALWSKLAAHYRVEDALDVGHIVRATDALAHRLGPIHRALGTLEELQVPMAEAREYLRIEGMGAQAARNFRDKALMKSVLAEHGLPCARHRLVESPQEAREFVTEVGYPVIAKPPAGSGARGTFRIDRPEALSQFFTVSPLNADRPVLFEEFIVGEEHSFDSVFLQGRPVWFSINHYYPTPLEVLQSPWIQWCVLLPREVMSPIYDDIRSVAFRALEVLGMRSGFSHMEWFRRRDGSAAISEVGARPPGAQFMTLISHAHDLDMYRAWARLMVTDEFDPPVRRYAAGAAYLRGQGEGRVRAIHGLQQAQQELGDLVVEAKLPREGQSASGTYEGEGFVIVRHPETRVVEDALRRLVTILRVELG